MEKYRVNDGGGGDDRGKGPIQHLTFPKGLKLTLLMLAPNEMMNTVAIFGMCYKHSFS